MKYFFGTLLVLVLITSFGCTYGDKIQRSVIRVSEESYEPNYNKIDLKFDDIEPDYEYKQIAFIEFVGDDYSTVKGLLYSAVKEAQALGADALIRIRVSHINREKVDVILALDNDYEPDSYTTPIVKGIAVKYVKTVK